MRPAGQAVMLFGCLSQFGVVCVTAVRCNHTPWHAVLGAHCACNASTHTCMHAMQARMHACTYTHMHARNLSEPNGHIYTYTVHTLRDEERCEGEDHSGTVQCGTFRKALRCLVIRAVDLRTQ